MKDNLPNPQFVKVTPDCPMCGQDWHEVMYNETRERTYKYCPAYRKGEFTNNELACLKQIYDSALGNGFDFGFADEVRPAHMTPRSAGACFRQLRKKLEFYTDEEFAQVCFSWVGDEQPSSGANFEEFLRKVKRVESHKRAFGNCEQCGRMRCAIWFVGSKLLCKKCKGN